MELYSVCQHGANQIIDDDDDATIDCKPPPKRTDVYNECHYVPRSGHAPL